MRADFLGNLANPCTSEMPAMQTVYDQLRKRISWYWLSMSWEDEAKVREHIQQKQTYVPRCCSTARIRYNQYGVFGPPVSVFIDQRASCRNTSKAI